MTQATPIPPEEVEVGDVLRVDLPVREISATYKGMVWVTPPNGLPAHCHALIDPRAAISITRPDKPWAVGKVEGRVTFYGTSVEEICGIRGNQAWVLSRVLSASPFTVFLSDLKREG